MRKCTIWGVDLCTIKVTFNNLFIHIASSRVQHRCSGIFSYSSLAFIKCTKLYFQFIELNCLLKFISVIFDESIATKSDITICGADRINQTKFINFIRSYPYIHAINITVILTERIKSSIDFLSFVYGPVNQYFRTSC